MNALLSLLAAFALQPESAPAEVVAPPPLQVMEAVPAEAAKDNADSEAPAVAIWQLSDEDTTIYLLGTIHIFSSDLDWQNDRLSDIIDESDELITEAKIDATAMKMLGAFAKVGFSKDNPPLAQRLDEERQARFAAFVEEMGLPPSFYDKLDSWVLGMMLELFGGGFDSAMPGGSMSGAEEQLQLQFEAADKPHGELESWQEQLLILDSLSPAAQDAYLEASIDAMAQLKEAKERGEEETPLNSLVSSWTQGDVDAIAEIFGEDSAYSEEFVDVILYQRNRNWVDWIERRMDQPGTILVAVGAAHLAGNKSVVDYLEQKGRTVTRIQ